MKAPQRFWKGVYYALGWAFNLAVLWILFDLFKWLRTLPWY